MLRTDGRGRYYAPAPPLHVRAVHVAFGSDWATGLRERSGFAGPKPAGFGDETPV